MKVAAVLVCAITAILCKEIELNKNGCPIDYTIEKLIKHENCNEYYQCFHGTLVKRKCQEALLFNEKKNICDWPHNVKCENERNSENNVENDKIDKNQNERNSEKYNCNPNEAASLCSKSGSDGVLVAHEHCNKFYKCSHGKNISMSCPGALLYNPYKEWCDYPINVKCGDRIIPDPVEDEKENEQEDNNNGSGGINDNNNNNNNNDKGSCNCVPGEAPSICSKLGSDGVLVAHEHCNKFYKCSHGKNISMSCPGALLYNPYKEWCDYPINVKCGDRIIPDPVEDEKENEQEDNNNGSGGINDNDNNNNNDKGSCNCVPGEAPSICSKLGSDGVLVAHEHCNKFYKCSHGKNISMSCPGALLYNPYKEWCDYSVNVKCGDRIIPDPVEDEKENEQEDNNNGSGGNNDNDNNNNNDKGSCNCVPGEAPSICSKLGSDGVLVAHEHCNKFYKCSHGKNISMSCPGALLYNPYKEWCDYPINVKCGDRIIPDPVEDEKENEQEDNNNGSGGINDNDNNNNNDKGSCNCVPGEAPSICSKLGSDGVLVAHEHCNKFYKCSHGKNISMSCPGALLYNPYKEWCDYPINVKCGDRIIPDPVEDEKENEQEDNNNGSGGINDNDNNNNNDKGSCNCVPGEAPSICSKLGSDGVLVAHEHCNKFYKCSHGKNISMSCPGALLYNPYKEWCDYPVNVKCGDRIIPDPVEDEKENEQEDNNNGSGGINDNDNNNNNDKGSCNCVPGEAPSICSKLGSDGVLVAHEHCNKFYKCSHGKNISMSCPGALLYNPYKEWCDYPINVKCGDRIIPDPVEDEKENEQEDNNNGSGGINDNDNNNNNDKGSCNCVPGEAPSICSKLGSDGVLVAHEHCNKFYKCSHGKNISMSCPGALFYNPYKEWCDYPVNVKCGDRIIPDPVEDEKENEQEDNNNGSGGINDNDNNNNNDKGSCNCVPGEAPSICSKLGSDGVLVAHEHCNKFYKCSHGKNISMSCPGALLYNPYKEWCDYPVNVKCGDRIIPDPVEDEKENEQGDNNNNSGGNNDNDNNNNNDKGSCNCVPGEAPSICSKLGSDGVLVAHEHCNKFYKCSHGKNISMSCPGALLYNPYKEWCDYPVNVKCGDRIIPDPVEDEKENEQEDNNNGSGGINDNDNNNNNDKGSCNCVPGEAPSICSKLGSDGVLVAHEHCNKFYKCSHGKNISMSCPGALLYNPYKEWCDYPVNVKCGDRIIPDPVEDEKENEQEDNNNGSGGINDNDNNNNNDKGSCNCVPGEAPSICSKLGSDGVLVAHEHCNKFYKCSHGKNISMSCPGALLYNPYKEWCDYPVNVKCGDRIIPDPVEDEKENEQGDNNNNSGGNNDNDNNNNNDKGSCNCVPGEAPSICSKLGSDGVLVAHEHCNKFYKCSHGKNISMSCPGALLYNPYKEWCDYPVNVKCGDRIIPDPVEDEKENEQEDNNNGSGGINDNDNNNNNDKGSCNCVPGEAPSICSKLGSDGVLVAHEHCNKFYKCSHGKNISMSCPGALLYNPYKEWCDYPINVKCGDRIIPDPVEDEKENEQEDNNNGSGGINDNDNNNNNDKGSCNCVPGEAPSICSKLGSDGVLVAHEHCNKFYKCSHGKNISMSCPGALLYNPYKEWCDYPVNVKCGDRIIPDPVEDEKENEQEDNNNGSGGINDNDNNNNNDKGSCNCVPGEAPSICSKLGSDGVLVAHEHCNKFYKCSHGKNISMSCPGALLYNPYKEWCDYPVNVKCGDRIIPDPVEDEKENEQEDNNNGSGGINDNDNNNNNDKGSCNCVPGEAPSICSKLGSDGVLVAHEHCNKFYKCSHGKNISMSCPGALLYNPYKEWCDYPVNIKCGDRIIPDPIEDEKENEQEDNNNGTNNCNPAEASAICAKDGSDGVLLAHEYCHMFYKCSRGANITMICPENLLYNSLKEWCDFPVNVQCNNRIVLDKSTNRNSVVLQW